MAKNISNLEREMNSQIHDDERYPNRLSWKRIHQDTLQWNFQDLKAKREFWKKQEKVIRHIKDFPLKTDFSIETL